MADIGISKERSSELAALQAAANRGRERAAPRTTTQAKLPSAKSPFEIESPERVRMRLRRLLGQVQDRMNKGVTRAPNILPFLYECLLGRTDLLAVRYLEEGESCARSVGRISVANRPCGTGFLVSSRLLLTNHHVLPTPDHAARAEIQFNYEEPRPPAAMRFENFRFCADEFFISSEDLDYTLIAVEPHSESDTAMLSEFSFLPLIGEEGKCLVGERVNIIQHPRGELKQVALRENQVVDLLADHVHYRADTMHGSSGAPVCNDQWEVVALHHMAVPRCDEQGRILNRSGGVWDEDQGADAIDHIANEGIRVSSLVRDLRARRATLAAAAQALLDQVLLGKAPALASPVLPLPLPSVVPPALSPTAAPSLSLSAEPLCRVVEIVAPVAQPLRIRLDLHITPDSGCAVRAPELPEPAAAAPVFVEIHASPDVAVETRTSAYYDELGDAVARAQYYAGAPLDGTGTALAEWLHARLRHTHTRYLEFNPSLYLYADVDVRPDGSFRCIYSGTAFTREALLGIDRTIENQRRAALDEQLCSMVTETSPAELKALLLAVEDRLPFSCEHAVPERWFGKSNPLRGDLHNLFVCDARHVAFRGGASYASLSRSGTDWTCESSPAGRRDGASFEPVQGRGAVARAVLYFLLRYRSDRDHIEPLRMSGPALLMLLRSWHEADPVSLYERHRNVIIQRLQGCRNPLIDMPELVSRLDLLD